ncbi:hypothetical protein FB45DRAFT_1038845 [Roridomyces roridus]|uniref:Uncharacterized protein n=1 Tax=Roridomyces roridus TaxID=1738132 RepID=A0AAD7F8S8_9AGAR|nr:hypothetical protein FB45DRAFT_1038845 [Roridomyces roridus]
MSDAATSHTHPLTTDNLAPADPPPYPKHAENLAIITNATSQELICSGNPAFAHLIQSNMRSAEEYTTLVRAYLRLAEYCHYVVKMHSDIRQVCTVSLHLPSQISSRASLSERQLENYPPFWPFDPDRPSAEEAAGLYEYRAVFRTSPGLQCSLAELQSR